MKNFLIICIIGVVMASCSSDTSEISDSNAISTTNHNLKNFAGEKYYDNGGDDYGCKDTGGDCLDPVIINVDQSFTLMANTVLQGVQSNTRSYFSSNRGFLSTFVDRHYIDGTIDGTYLVYGRGDINRKFYLIFKNSQGGALEVVYPLFN